MGEENTVIHSGILLCPKKESVWVIYSSADTTKTIQGGESDGMVKEINSNKFRIQALGKKVEKHKAVGDGIWWNVTGKLKAPRNWGKNTREGKRPSALPLWFAAA